ncbi:MAG: hypothetical protein RL754_142 [Bacteroidota bacterium]
MAREARQAAESRLLTTWWNSPYISPMKNTTLILGFLLLSALTAHAQNSFPYAFTKASWNATFVGIAAQSAAFAIPDPVLSHESIDNLNATQVNWFDRAATRNYSLSYAKRSDQTLNILMVAPATTSAALLRTHSFNNTLTYAGMYLETFVITNGTKDLIKDLFGRTRPVFYNSNLSLSDRYDLADMGDGRTSFYSGHTAVAFSSAVFLASTHDELYDAPMRSAALWTVSLGLAGYTAYARYEAGKHFPTDILAGAIIGSALGYGIPKLHMVRHSGWSFSTHPQGLSLNYDLTCRFLM